MPHAVSANRWATLCATRERRSIQSLKGGTMANDELSGSAFDEWLLEPDCPQCGSEDVVCLEARAGGTKVWYCNKCGHTWVE